MNDNVIWFNAYLAILGSGDKELVDNIVECSDKALNDYKAKWPEKVDHA